MNVYTVTLAFNKPSIVEQSLAQYRATQSGLFAFRHLLVDNCYPLGGKQKNRAEIKRIAGQYGCELLEPGKNLGLHDGFNWALSQMRMTDDDIVIGFDGDCYPVSNGWDMALVTALKFGGDVAWASLMNDISRRELNDRGFTPRDINQLTVWETHRPCVNSVCAWTWPFLKRAGGLKEPTKYYGGLECTMWPELQKQGKKWVYVDGYWEREMFYDQIDPLYRAYKWHHAHTGEWPGDFESYCIAKGGVV